MSTGKSFAPSAAMECNAAHSRDASPTITGVAHPSLDARTLFVRATDGTRPADATARRRREWLLAHSARSSARREALAALLRSSALADAASVDPLLRRDVMRLVAFVRDDLSPATPVPQAD